jgi:tRNA A-37 threonylcarbamoyl transferase component Bud32
VFGFDHAQVSGELLRRWQLPDALVQPIRHHHNPDALGDRSPALRERCERLGFVDALTHLDRVAQHPDDLDALLRQADTRYGLGHAELVRFLEGVVPKVEEFTALRNVDAGACPNYADTLARGSSELFLLAVGSGTVGTASTVRTPAPPPAGPREFHPDCLEVFPVGGCSLDGYHLKRVLGRGAMGVVFEGYDRTLDRSVAIKMMLPEVAELDHCRRRFIREAKSVAAVRGENVVAIHAVKENGPYTYLVMEFVEGPSLADRVDDGSPMTADELTALAAQLARGLAAAHAQRIVHRDVKPENVLLDRVSGQAKLTDFGLAQVDTDVRLTADGGLIGTPLYMSPEQAAGHPVGPRSDLFSLGAVLYTAATGRPPFDDRTMFGVLKKVCEATPAAPSLLRPDLPAWFDSLVLKLLAKAENDRYQSAEEVLHAIATTKADTPQTKRTW